MHCLFLFSISFFFTEFVMKNGNYVKKIVIFFLFSALQNWLFRFKAFFNLLYFLVKENRIFSKADGWSFGWHVNCINKETKKKRNTTNCSYFLFIQKVKKFYFALLKCCWVFFFFYFFDCEKFFVLLIYFNFLILLNERCSQVKWHHVCVGDVKQKTKIMLRIRNCLTKSKNRQQLMLFIKHVF